ncbi:hypothetical protein M1466_01770 [Candidatus Dependentiae bacterium]|nr:hypothetical protein [Candidatus Dependentiae bacterium]
MALFYPPFAERWVKSNPEFALVVPTIIIYILFRLHTPFNPLFTALTPDYLSFSIFLIAGTIFNGIAFLWVVFSCQYLGYLDGGTVTRWLKKYRTAIIVMLSILIVADAWLYMRYYFF